MIVLRGLPGSGMTQYSFEYMSTHDSFERISKKDMFAMFYCKPSKNVIKHQLSKFITNLKQKMKSGFDIIIDDLNLNPYHHYFYTKLASVYNYKVEFKFLESSIADSLHNISIKIGEKPTIKSFLIASKDEITNLAKKYGLCREETDTKQNSEYVVYGLDDCLANTDERREFATSKNGFDEVCFNKKYIVGLDEPYQDVLNMLQEDFRTGYKIVICTNRNEDLKGVTEEWLNEHNIDYHYLVMKNKYQTITEHMYKLFSIQKKFGLNLCAKIVDNNQEVINVFERFKVAGVLIERKIQPNQTSVA